MNILRLNRALFRALTGESNGLEVPEVNPNHAPNEDERMRAEEISEQDAETWLRGAEWRVPRVT